MEYTRDNEYKIDGEKRTRTFGSHLAPITKTLGLSARQENCGAETKTLKPVPQKTTPQKKFWKKLTPAEMAERRAKRLCFNCDDLYTPGHVCSPVLFYIMPVAEGENKEDEWLEEDELEISLNAMNGEQTEQTFQVQADIAKGTGWVLLDTGSTHNFIKSSLVEELGIPIHRKHGRFFALPDGGKCPIQGFFQGMVMSVQGYQFKADCFAIPLQGFDVVLGIRWLNALGRVIWDGPNKSVEFHHNSTPLVWRGESKTQGKQHVSLHALECQEETLANWFSDEEVFTTPGFALPTEAQAPKPSIWALAQVAPSDLLDKVINKFSRVFEKPIGLPPKRDCDHRIRLLQGSNPVAVRPYRYPHLLKDEIERQCAEMLHNGVIRPSNTPFSSSVLLVKKADNTWRFCIDYRDLNKIIVKDKFPITIVDELLDELHGARFFTKLDLTSGYHQVRMFDADIEKTAFRTHHGHYEFLVMPFGLVNAPSTFQSLMNSVFTEVLRKFILVFFYDILIYSKTWAEHVRHVEYVLKALQTHQLLSKRVKCSFGTREVDYLGHIISQKGVQVDHKKLKLLLNGRNLHLVVLCEDSWVWQDITKNHSRLWICGGSINLAPEEYGVYLDRDYNRGFHRP